jgi:hypothetical protein
MGDLVISGLMQILRNSLDKVMQFLPHLLVMLIIVVAGWFVAAVLKILVRHFLRLVKFNEFCESAGASQLLQKAALPSPAELASRLVFWLMWVGFLLLGLTALGIAGLQEHISRFFLLLPEVLVALVVLFLGLLAANFFSRAVLLAAVNADLPGARLLSGFVRFIIVLLALTMALEQIAVSQRALLIAFTIAFGAVMLALSIAFGIGGQQVARRMLEKRFLDEEEKEKHEEISPL